MNEKRQPVSFLKLFTGTVMGIVGYVVVFAALIYIGLTGSFVRAVLFIPDLLGLVQHVTPENTLDFSGPGTYTIHNLKEGDYLIYVNQSPYRPRVTLTSLATGETISAPDFRVEGNERETPLAVTNQYQLALEFSISAAGDYEITIANFPGALRITPNVSKNVNTVFVLGLIIQPLLLYSLFRTIYRWRNREKIAAAQNFRDRRGEKFDEWVTQAKEKKDS